MTNFDGMRKADESLSYRSKTVLGYTWDDYETEDENSEKNLGMIAFNTEFTIDRHFFGFNDRLTILPANAGSPMVKFSSLDKRKSAPACVEINAIHNFTEQTQRFTRKEYANGKATVDFSVWMRQIMRTGRPILVRVNFFFDDPELYSTFYFYIARPTVD
jgi:hypothetical protein